MSLELGIVGDSALFIRFGHDIDANISAKVRAARLVLEEEHIEGIIEFVPTYCTLYIFFDPLRIETGDLTRKLSEAVSISEHKQLPRPKIIETPVVYGGEYGPDLDELAKLNGLTPEEVIKLHASRDYLVYMLGFTPGFAFCGSVDDKIASPRKKDPRLKVPPGSVGIAGKQTGLYAVASPGGWQLIGRTYKRFYNPSKKEPIPVRAGDYIRFLPVSPEEFEARRDDIDAADAPTDYSDWNAAGTEIFETLSAGALTTIQDRGRYGYQELGISCSGAMDEVSFKTANRLVGNDDNAPALEITMIGPRFKVLGDALAAITGANLSAMLDGRPAPMYEAFRISRGSVIVFGAPVSGARSYIAVSGGFCVPYVMDSASTNLKAGIGGYKGRKLEKGDILKRNPSEVSPNFEGFSVDPKELDFAPPDGAIRVIPGPEEDHFTEAGIRTFYESEYRVGANADRMGVRLEGPAVEHGAKGANIVSDGITFGSVQIPGEGYPIALLKDRQSVGGYPKIGTICTVDAWRMGQKKPGDTVRFRKVTPEEGRELLARAERATRRFRITVEGKVFDVLVEEKRA